MKPAELRAILDVLRECGVSEASIPVIDDTMQVARATPLTIKFAPIQAPEALFVDAKGDPVDLDADLPPLARDPDAELVAKNFPPRS